MWGNGAVEITGGIGDTRRYREHHSLRSIWRCYIWRYMPLFTEKWMLRSELNVVSLCASCFGTRCVNLETLPEVPAMNRSTSSTPCCTNSDWHNAFNCGSITSRLRGSSQWQLRQLSMCSMSLVVQGRALLSLSVMESSCMKSCLHSDNFFKEYSTSGSQSRCRCSSAVTR